MALFKFLRTEFADALLKRGEVRIGTLYEFRTWEESDLARRDAKEGKKTVRKPFPYTTLHGRADEEPTRKRIAQELGFVVPAGAQRVEVGHNVTSEHTESTNVYIYSTAEQYHPDLLEDFSADVAVVITNPTAFFRAISRHLGDRARGLRLDRCVYAPREHLVGTIPDVHPCWLKDVEYERQKEVRAAWQPSDADPSPLILRCPELSLYCSRYEDGTEMPSGTEFVGRRIVEMTLELDGCQFENCVFENCTLIYGGGFVRLLGNTLHNCRWIFADSAMRTISLLRGLHADTRDGAHSQVVHWLEQTSFDGTPETK